LNFEAVARIVQTAAGVEQAVDDELLVVDGQLDGDEGQVFFGEGGGWFVGVRFVALVAVVQPDQLIAVNAVERQDDHDEEVWHQQADVKGIPAVDVAERVVRIVRLPVVPEAMRSQEQGERIELA